MPIIINEFEIDVEPPPQQSRGEGAEQTAAPQSSKMKPEEITSVVRLQRERLERLRAD